MTREEAAAALARLNASIATAVLLIRAERDILDRFFAEARTFDTLGPILDPTLWMSRERQVTEALLKPIYEAARALVDTYDRQLASVAPALREALGGAPDIAEDPR